MFRDFSAAVLEARSLTEVGGRADGGYLDRRSSALGFTAAKSLVSEPTRRACDSARSESRRTANRSASPEPMERTEMVRAPMMPGGTLRASQRLLQQDQAFEGQAEGDSQGLVGRLDGRSGMKGGGVERGKDKGTVVSGFGGE